MARRALAEVRGVSEMYVLRVNGDERAVADAWLGESLLYVLRERLGLPGREGRVRAGRVRLVLGAGRRRAGVRVPRARGRRRSAPRSSPSKGCSPSERGALSDVQRAFVETGAVQCGFCTPGLVMAVHDLLERDPEPTDLAVREAISGNLCRCTGYGRILDAVAGRGRATRVGSAARDASTIGTARRGRDRRARDPARRHRQGAGRVRVRGRPLGRRHAVGPGAALAAPVGAHPRRSTSAPALAIPGVHAVLTADDVPVNRYGLEHRDQPVLAADVVRYVG